MIDDFCKRLVARHPDSIGRWLLEVAAPPELTPPTSSALGEWKLLDRELSSEPLHADSVVLLPGDGHGAPILHLEFQTRPDPCIAERMLDYWIRLHRRFNLPIHQVVIHLKPTSSPLARIEHLTVGNTRHRFVSLRLWEQDAAPLLADNALLPLAVLARAGESPAEHLLRRVRQRLQAIPDPDQRRLITSGCQLLAGLTFPQGVIQRLLAMSILEDSSVYQYIVRKGLEEGRELGLQQGMEQGLERGRQLEATALILRQLERRCGGPISTDLLTAVSALPLDRLEALADAILDFQGFGDLSIWLALESHPG